MPLPRSVLLARPVVPAAAPSVRTIRAYGHLDDPVRLLVVLADYVGTVVSGKEDRVAHCLDRRATWRSRLGALKELLAATKSLSQSYAALIDPDALAPANRPDWDDRTLHRMREDIRKVLFAAVDEGGWLVAQPNPTRAVSEELDQVNLDPEEATGNLDPEFAVFAPDVQPVARWLVKTGRLPSERLAAIIEDARDPGLFILRVAYEALPEGPRESARRLHVLRAPNERNGHLGPFKWTPQPNDPLEVAAQDVDALESAGLLSSDDARRPKDRVMSRRVRDVFALQANAFERNVVRQIHGQLAEDEQFAKRSVEEKIEVHHHAARAGNIPRAAETADYFGLELRALATQISRTPPNDYEGAAKIFRELVDEFDNTDAYAWEYLGYNLALADKKAKKKGKRADDILRAYREAHTNDKTNPLYHGRLLGYRAELGHPVVSEVNAAMAKYAERSDAGDFVSWFVMPVLDGLYRGGRHDERKQIVDAWGTLLRWCAPGVLEKHGAGDE